MSGGPLAPATAFRRRLLRMFDPKGRTYAINDGDDEWGLVVTRKNLTGVQVWYAADTGVLTLGLTSPEMRAAVPPDVVLPGATEEKSPSGWRMFRWDVPRLDVREPPEGQAGAKEVVAGITGAFDWLRSVRTDIA